MQLRKVIVFAGLPIAAVALAVFLLSWGNGTPQAQAAVDPAVNFSISDTGCGTGIGETPKCNVPTGGKLILAVNLDVLPSNGSYDGYDATLTYTAGLTTGPGASGCEWTTKAATDFCLDQTGTGNWPDCVFNASDFSTAGTVVIGCGIGISAPSSSYVGSLAHLNFFCGSTASTETITLVSGDGNTDTVDSAGGIHSEAADESLTVNCQEATVTPLPTATSTPPPQPRVQKVCVPSTPPKSDTDLGHQTGSTSDHNTALCNFFLEREGAKIPAPTCPEANNQVNIEERINIPITSPDTKNPNQFAQLGAFEFEIRFDEKLVCVTVEAGPVFSGPNAVCTTVVLEGIVRFGCVTIGKGNDLNDQVPEEALAIIQVRPTEELVNIIRPNQENGVVVQIMNQGCELADEQGAVIPIFSCEDLDITFRFLEGDVDGPDCDVDVLDAQNVAFRWGATRGSLLFNQFMDLEPSPQDGGLNGDDDIDIKDLQFVFGRLTSTCENPWPPEQEIPVKAKA